MVAHPADERSSSLPPALLERDEVRRALQVLTLPGQVMELRILSARTAASPRYAYQASGYFNDAEALVKALTGLRGAHGVYITLHPCKPELLARAHNRLRRADEMRQAAATNDQQVTRLRWLLLDLDPERPAGISSTEEEHQTALDQAQVIKAALQELGWPDPLEADSGNGAHLLYRIDLPVAEGTKETGLVHRVLKGLATQFDVTRERPGDEPLRVLLDQAVFNPSRICKLYGTLACKGDHTTERPHRMAHLLTIPAQLDVVPQEQLEAIAAPAPAARLQGRAERVRGAFNLPTWIAEHQLDVSDPKPWQGGQRWIFNVCPWNVEHTDHSAFLVQRADGAIAAGCHHNSCQGKGWKELRALYEPRRESLAKQVLPFPTLPTGDLPELRDLPEVELDFVLDCLQREEEGDACLYARLFCGRCIYDHTERLWYEWQGHFWKRDDYKHALVLASGPLAATYLSASAMLSEQASEEERRMSPHLAEQETQQARERYVQLKNTTAALIERARRLKKLQRAQNVLTYAQSFLHIQSSAWDTDPWLLGTPDGVIDLRTGSLHPGKPEQYIRTIIPTRWRGINAPAPRFERFLQEIFADRATSEREELISFLQRALGYGISGKVVEHIFLVLYGEEGRNGKDTLMTLVLTVLGAVVGPVSNDVILTSGRLASPGSAKPHLCSLQGKRIAWASETDRGARFDVGQVKFLTGGGAISARQLYGRDYTFDPSHLLVLLTNHKPHADASDAAFWDRLCPIIFNVRFVEHPTQANERQRDTLLGQALQAEASGILAWLVRGCLQWQKQGLAVPASVLLARKSYREEEDTLGDFLQECCVCDETRSVSAGKLYEHYKTWAVNNGLKYMNGRAFGQEMKKRFAWGHTKIGNVYLGVDTLADDESAEEWVKGQRSLSEMPKASSQAGSHSEENPTGEGSEAFPPKPPFKDSQKREKESFWQVPSLPSPVEVTEEMLNEPPKPSNTEFLRDNSCHIDPSPTEFYEEFDL